MHKGDDMYMAGLHNNHFRKNKDWMPNIYKTKSHKQIYRNKLRFKSIPIWGTPKEKSCSFTKAGVCGSGHYSWRSKNHQLIKFHQAYGFRHFMQNKYTIYNKLRKDGKHNFHEYNWKEFYFYHKPIISIRDSMDMNFNKMNNKIKFNRGLRKKIDWDKPIRRGR